MIDPRIFRSYDIRGHAGTQLTEEACRLIGLAFGHELRKRYSIKTPNVVVGRDCRTHSPDFEAQVVFGLTDAGCNVYKIGMTPSPVNYFTICNGRYDGGIVVTASHNPKEDNGLKLQTRAAAPFSGEELQKLRETIHNSQLTIDNKNQGSVQDIDAVMPYMERLVSMFAGVGNRMKVGVDTGNGAAGPVVVSVLRSLGCVITELFTTPDGTFPNHAADPSKYSTLVDLQQAVTSGGLSLGLAFDGDGDRLGLVDEKGTIVTADQILLLLAEDHLQRYHGAPIVYTVSNSSLIATEVKKWGGEGVMCKVGHSHVEHAMREVGAHLGGEQSGHFFVGESYFGFDDALVAALRVLSIVQSRGTPLSELIARFPKVFQALERRPACPDEKKADVVDRATKYFQTKYPVVTLDGARIDFGDSAWAGIRYSNTSPVLSICIEARSEERLKEVEAEVLEHMRTYAEVEL